MNHIDAMQENKQDVECNEEQILKKNIMVIAKICFLNALVSSSILLFHNDCCLVKVGCYVLWGDDSVWRMLQRAGASGQYDSESDIAVFAEEQ